MYNFLKKNIPTKYKQLFKPVYERWCLRNFKTPLGVKVKNAGQNYVLQLDPANGAVDEYIYIHSYWEEHVAFVIKKYLPAGGVFVDVGANIGAFTFMAAKIVGPAGKVHAFEPLPQLCDQMQLSKKYNQAENVYIHNQGCAAEAGTITLRTNPKNIGGSSAINGTEADTLVKVDVVQLDSVLKDSNRVDVIKIDVEGHEYEVLKGAQQLLKKHQPVIVLEFSPHLYRLMDDSIVSDLLVFLKNQGYKMYDVDYAREIGDVSEYIDWIGERQTNLLCTIPQKEKY